MPKLDDISDFANRGLDAMFPARRLARQAFLANTAGRLMAAQKENPEDYANAMQYGEDLTSSAKKIRDMAKANASAKQGNNFESGMKKGGVIKSASKRADGIAKRGKTRGKLY